MAVKHSNRVASTLLIGLPILSNVVSFVIFAPLFVPGKAPTSGDFQRAGNLLGIAILVMEVLALLVIALSLRHESTSLARLINFRSPRVRLYLVATLIALLPTLAAGWLYSLGQAQAGVESE